MQPFITAEEAIYNQIEPVADPEKTPVQQQQGEILQKLLNALYSAGCLSVKGKILKYWLEANGGSPIFRGSPEIIYIAKRLGHAQTNHITKHLGNIAKSAPLDKYFHYCK